MNISLITVTFNSASTIINTLDSVLSQYYKNFEYIIIDGASTDNTLDIIKEYDPLFAGKMRLISEPDKGIYDALNKGISLATGDIIGIVHGDDMLADESVLDCIAKQFKDSNCDVLYGDLIYINESQETVRDWKSRDFNPKLLKAGWMPPHPTLYVKRKVIDEIGYYNLDYRIASDYDFILRVFTHVCPDRMAYLNKLIIKMRVGGVSNNSWKNIRCKMREDLDILQKNKVGGIYTLMMKNTSKLTQFIRNDKAKPHKRKDNKFPFLLKAFSFAINYLNTDILRRRIKPRVLQMPITSKCNSRCITCNIWKFKTNINIDPIALRKALSDKYFNKVHTIGLNGGEPSTYKQTEELVDTLFSLKKLRRIHIISNGLIYKNLAEMMKIITQKCRDRGIKVYLTISIDGVGEIHDNIRGIPGAFEKTVSTIKQINLNREDYCDVLDIGTTLSNQNIEYAACIEAFNDSLNIPSYYHPAVPNKRLSNFDDHSFGVLNDKRSEQLTTEFFFGKFKEGRGIKNRMRAFLSYYYFANNGTRRLAGCNYLRSDVTITEDLDMCLCATASDKVGNLRDKTASQISKEGLLKKEEKQVMKHCDSCIHYVIFPNIKGLYLFTKALLKPLVWIQYKYKAAWLR